MTLSVADYTAAIRSAGDRTLAATEATDLSSPVPTCPGWTLGDLLKHLTYVHTWAKDYVAGGITEMVPTLSEPEHLAAAADDGIVDRYRAAVDALIDALQSADPDRQIWSFMPAPSPLVFWARRQAYEATIHSVDAQLAARRQPPTVDDDLALDGTDELLNGFAQLRRRRIVADPPISLAIRGRDAQPSWSIHMTPEGADIRTPASDADCTVSGDPSRLYLLLWNRAGRDGLEIVGDARALEVFRDRLRITWNR